MARQSRARDEQRRDEVEGGLLAEPERQADRRAGEEGVGGRRGRPAGAEDEPEHDHRGGGAIGEDGVPGVGACGGERDEQARDPGGAATEAEAIGEGGDEGRGEGGDGEPQVAQHGLQGPRGGAECEREARHEVGGQDEERSAEEESADAAVQGLLDVAQAVPVERRARPDGEGRGHRE